MNFKRNNENIYTRNLSKERIIGMVSLIIVILFLTFYPFRCLYEEYGGKCGHIGDILGKCSFIERGVFVVFLQPFIETLVFQFLIIEILININFFKNNENLIILISAYFFAIVHNYDFIYFLFALLEGIILSYIYLYFNKKGDFPFFIVFSIHSLSNIGIFIMNVCLGI